MAKLTPAEIKARLPELPSWKKQGATLVRTFQFEDFAGALKFVNAVGRRSEKARHHPDIDIRWNRVTLGLTTHSAGGLTALDFALAKQCDDLV